jgi:hypothetical protein
MTLRMYSSLVVHVRILRLRGRQPERSDGECGVEGLFGEVELGAVGGVDGRAVVVCQIPAVLSGQVVMPVEWV